MTLGVVGTYAVGISGDGERDGCFDRLNCRVDGPGEGRKAKAIAAPRGEGACA